MSQSSSAVQNVHEPTPQQIAERKVYAEMGLSDEEFALVERLLGRKPNYTETGLFSVMWSEHCSYKNSKPVLNKFPTEGEHVLQGPGEGAGVVDIGDGQAVVFKMESHNHPSAIEPYQGAATGVGGIIRDVFSMGARPIALLNALRFGELDTPKVKYLFENVVAGIAGYGNCVGIPTVGGDVYFDDCYAGNPLVNAMCVGLIDHDDLQQGVAQGIGNPVMYVGASTGKDGIHGATFASEELSESSEEKRPSVQAGDPFMEKLLIEACLELLQTGAVLGIQDMGAAGLTSSSAEMASKAGNGIELNLDHVPQREKGMSAYEMMLSESQERMLLVVEKGRELEIKAVCDKWQIMCETIGQVTDDQRLKVWQHNQLQADVPVDSLAEEAPVYHKPSQIPEYYRRFQAQPEPRLEVENAASTLHQLLSSPTVASKKWVYEQYDHMVRTDTVVQPGSDAAVVRIKGTDKALAMTVDCNARYIYLDPEVGGAIAVAEAARNIACSGAKPLAITDCLNFGSPEDPEIFWQLEKAVQGMSQACEILHTPVISGNVSLYNENATAAIQPTPMVGMVGLLEHVQHITTQRFDQAEQKIVLLGETKPEFGGSELQKLLQGEISGKAPALDIEREKQLIHLVQTAIKENLVHAAHDISEGGLAVALSEALISGDHGADVYLEGDESVTAQLFAESQSRIIVSVEDEKVQTLQELAQQHAIPCTVIGQVTESPQLRLSVNGEQVCTESMSGLRRSWEEAIPCRMNH